MAKPLKRVLIVTDLEGVTPVNDVAALCFGHRRYRNACRALTNELLAVVRGLAARGVREIVVSDSHRGGNPSSNIELERLPNLRVLEPGQLPEFSGGHGEPQIALAYWDDAFDERLMRGADALVALGMHPGAGVDAFASHTVAPHCRWWLGERPVDELDILLGLAAELQIPLLLATGDSRILESLSPSLHQNFLITKSSQSHRALTCCDAVTICTHLEQLVSNTEPQDLILLADLPLRLEFKSGWCSRILPQSMAGMAGESFRRRYSECLQRVAQVSQTSAAAMVDACSIYAMEFSEVARVALGRPFADDRSGCTGHLDDRSELFRLTQETWEAFARLTVEQHDFSLALRALVLVMARHWTPGCFARLGLQPVLQEQLQLLKSIDQTYVTAKGELDGDVAMARMDAHYLLWLVGQQPTPPDESAVRKLLASLRRRGQSLFAWVIDNLYRRSQGQSLVAFAVPSQQRQATQSLLPLYVATHELFFACDYFLQPPAPSDFTDRFVELVACLVPNLVARQNWDAAAEVLLCLIYLGEGSYEPAQKLITALLQARRSDGSLNDLSQGGNFGDLSDHSTGLLFLILAGLEEFSLPWTAPTGVHSFA